jgi:hypothetical protein
MPAYPPVTTAVVPSSLRVPSASRAVVRAPKPEGMGACLVVM